MTDDEIARREERVKELLENTRGFLEVLAHHKGVGGCSDMPNKRMVALAIIEAEDDPVRRKPIRPRKKGR